MSLLLENSWHSSSHMDYSLPHLRNWKGVRAIACIWEVWFLHNLEMQLQHELAGLKTLWSLNYRYNESWLLNKGGAFIIKLCQCCTEHKAAKGAAVSDRLWLLPWHRWCFHQETMLIIIYLTFPHLSCWSVW